MDEAQRIVARANGGSGSPFIKFSEFQRLMRPGPASGAGSGSGGEALVVCVAHVSVDEEARELDLFERRLLGGGLRLRKLGRLRGGGGQPRGGGMRTFTLRGGGGGRGGAVAAPYMLTWRKGGLKSTLKGTFDLRHLTDVVAGGVARTLGGPGFGGGFGGVGGGGSDPGFGLGGNPGLQLFLVSPRGVLGLEVTRDRSVGGQAL